MLKLPRYIRQYVKLDLTEPLIDLPSVVVEEAKEKTDTVAMCYLLPKSASDIRYFWNLIQVLIMMVNLGLIMES